jgi:hypothetical protein
MKRKRVPGNDRRVESLKNSLMGPGRQRGSIFNRHSEEVASKRRSAYGKERVAPGGGGDDVHLKYGHAGKREIGGGGWL